MRVRGEKSENKWRRDGGRRPGRGEARCKGGGNRGETTLAGGAVGGQTHARTCGGVGSPEGEKCVGGPERESQAGRPRLDPQQRLD